MTWGNKGQKPTKPTPKNTPTRRNRGGRAPREAASPVPTPAASPGPAAGGTADPSASKAGQVTACGGERAAGRRGKLRPRQPTPPAGPSGRAAATPQGPPPPLPPPGGALRATRRRLGARRARHAPSTAPGAPSFAAPGRPPRRRTAGRSWPCPPDFLPAPFRGPARTVNPRRGRRRGGPSTRRPTAAPRPARKLCGAEQCGEDYLSFRRPPVTAGERERGRRGWCDPPPSGRGRGPLLASAPGAGRLTLPGAGYESWRERSPALSH